MSAPEQKLKPCPFCGSTDVRVHMYDQVLLCGEPDGFAQCHDCSVTSPTGASKELAIEAWNRRAPTGATHEQ